MYQIQVKLKLIRTCFNPAKGWVVHCHLDGMEMGKGGHQDETKAHVAAECRRELIEMGVHLTGHPRFPRGDVVAFRPSTKEAFLVEVEGSSSRQREQAIYSALGQLLFKMCDAPELGKVEYGVAVPDASEWHVFLERIPAEMRGALRLHLYFVGQDGVMHLPRPIMGYEFMEEPPAQQRAEADEARER